MRIELDREKKVVLLRWLKQGFIETGDVEGFDQHFTVEVVQTRDQLEECRRLSEMGCCAHECQ